MAKEEKEKKENEEEGSPEKRRIQFRFKFILAFGFFILNGALIAMGIFLVYSSTFGYKKSAVSEQDIKSEILEERDKEPIESLIYTMETFNTNLDGIPKRLIKVQVNLEMLDESGFEEIVSNEAKARDAVIHILNTKTFPEIESIQGKLHLKNEVINQLNSFLKKGIVKGVYFSKFAVQ